MRIGRVLSGRQPVPFKGIAVEQLPQDPPARALPGLFGDNGISEKLLKGRAVSHQTRLSQAEERIYGPRDVSRWFKESIRSREAPIATFNLKYRSYAALQVLCIVPRSPGLIPFENRPIDDLASYEMRQLPKRKKEQSELEDVKINIKYESKRESQEDGFESQEDGEVELLEGPPKKKVVIDLSHDDDDDEHGGIEDANGTEEQGDPALPQSEDQQRSAV